MNTSTVLFVCIHNAGRSQMAAGWLAHPAGDAVEVRSAGSVPAERLNPVAVQAMAEVGIDITRGVPTLLDYETAQAADVIITMGCGDTCPVFPGKSYRDWVLDDPAGQPIEVVRRIRDEIRNRVVELVAELRAATQIGDVLGTPRLVTVVTAPTRVRIAGDRVFRPAYWWTPAVHALLEHLHSVGFDRVPRPLGIVAGEEILSYLPGDSGADGWARVVPEAGLRNFAQLLRDFHQATAGFVAPPGIRWALSERPAGPGEVICHGDFGPWNVVWDGLQPVGLVDFDNAGPADPLADVAYALVYTAPFRDDEGAIRWQGFDRVPDRARRLELFAEAYGLSTVDGLVDRVIARQRSTIGQVRALADRGDERLREWVANGHLEHLADQVDWSRSHRHLFKRDRGSQPPAST